MKEDLINLIADSFGGLSYKLIPYFVFQLACSGLLTWFYFFLAAKKGELIFVSLRNGVTLSLVFCALSFFARFSLPLALFWSLITCAIIFKSLRFSFSENIPFVFCLAIAAIVGAGYLIPAIVVYAIGILFLFFTPKNKNTNNHSN